jgi:K+-transporting ATPase ATPase A chain
MTTLVSYATYLLVLVVLVPATGALLHQILDKESFGRVEKVVYRLIGVQPHVQQTWRTYAGSALWFNALSLGLVYALLRLQGSLPFNPRHLGGVSPYVAFNTAASFVTNTNWQAYAGESTLSYFSQMLALTVQNFVSPAVGMAALLALIRGLRGERTGKLGNFWVDLTRSILYVLLPLAFLTAALLVWQGVPQNLDDYTRVHGIQGFTQLIAQGPVASQVAIKQLGTNGGGFYNANSAHPFENPTPLTGFIELVAIVLLPAACVDMFGRMVGDRRQGYAILGTMIVLVVAGVALTSWSEDRASLALRSAGISAESGNLEGKEQRFGSAQSALWATVTTATSNGSVDSMHDSYNPLGLLAPMFNMAIGEVAFGGVGSGLYGMMFYVVLTVLLAGLMVGRTPEYLGKKIGAREVKIALLAILVPFLLVLGLTAISVLAPFTLQARLNDGPHGFSEVLYAWMSMVGNNGSAMAGLTATNWLYSVGGGVVMLVARFVPLIAAIALGGSLASQRRVPVTVGTLPTGTPLFAGFLTGVVVIVGGLTFFPALTLGPIVEQLMAKGGNLL